MNTLEKSSVEGARSIAKDYLKLQKGENFLVIYDETTSEIANYVIPVAKSTGAIVDAFQYNSESQAEVIDRDTFPFDLAEKIQKAQCILNILSANPQCTEFRKQIIRIGQKVGTRIAHAPGLSTEHLRIAFQADFDEMKRWNTILIRLLYFANNCTIITRDNAGNNFELNFCLGGITRLPAQSGIVRDGSWCNIPGSEVYIAPIEGSANGNIIINGSMLEHILKNDVLIKFKGGKIKHWKSMDPAFQEVLLTFSKTWEHDPNWNSLCELGIGLNNEFKEITGSQLLDEKIWGTCHIAIGDNKEFGGRIDSKIHQDFVTRYPDIIVDGKKIMKKGKFTIDESDVYEDLDKLIVKEKHFIGKSFRSTFRERETHNGKSGLDFFDGRNQPFFFQVGNDETSRKMLEYMDKLDPTPEFSFEEVQSKFQKAPAVLSLLLKYNFIEPFETEEND